MFVNTVLIQKKLHVLQLNTILYPILLYESSHLYHSTFDIIHRSSSFIYISTFYICYFFGWLVCFVSSYSYPKKLRFFASFFETPCWYVIKQKRLSNYEGQIKPEYS